MCIRDRYMGKHFLNHIEKKEPIEGISTDRGRRSDNTLMIPLAGAREVPLVPKTVERMNISPKRRLDDDLTRKMAVYRTKFCTEIYDYERIQVALNEKNKYQGQQRRETAGDESMEAPLKSKHPKLLTFPRGKQLILEQRGKNLKDFKTKVSKQFTLKDKSPAFIRNLLETSINQSLVSATLSPRGIRDDFDDEYALLKIRSMNFIPSQTDIETNRPQLAILRTENSLEEPYAVPNLAHQLTPGARSVSYTHLTLPTIYSV
eukprot:TRINITY_DN8408_c0_g1_i1.p1 TRINITY_DN8408_c0_g1~~TRINITY_DN8408_c0_g1_i1.p1  ORF type:complete len:280 (-),score=73.32 TRINITY_DN8408_c0_g1_i1:34-816(-)